MGPHPDPWRAIDRQPDPARYVRMMESRGRTPTQARVRRRFLRFCRIAAGWKVLEVGVGSGVVARDVAALVGPRGHVTGVDKSRVLIAAARRRAREEGLTVDVVPDLEEFLGLGAFIKSLLIGHPRDLDIVRAELTPIVAEHGRLVRTRHDYLEIIPVAASKGAALARLAEHVGVPLDRVVAVGDQENDLEMLREAGLGVAMPHAPEAVRRVADRIAPSAADGGLLRLLGELFPDHFA